MSDIFKKTNVYIMNDALLDLDLGMILTMRDKFPNNKYIESDIFQYNQNQIKYLLLNRKYENPLCLIMWDYSDDLYDDLYNKYREDIYKNSTFTNIINMLITTRKLDNIGITIICKDIQDKHLISTLYGGYIGTHKLAIIDDIEFKKDDNIFINKIGHILDRDDLYGTNLYLFKSMYNLEYNKKDDSYDMRSHIKSLGYHNNIKFLSPYIMDDSYIIKRRNMKNDK